MNILYVVDTFSVIEPMGVLHLSAISKAQGHKSFIAAIEKNNVEEKIGQHNIDCVAFSFMSTEARGFHQLAERLRALHPNLPIIAGGPHPTYYPQIIDSWPIDAVIVGEGEAVYPEIIKNLSEGKDISHISSVQTKHHKNSQKLLVENLDDIPFADRELLKDVAPYKYVRMKTFFGTRGCPYSCSYCFNSAYNKLYKGKGLIIRRRSVENLVSEIEQVVQKYPTDFVRFGDDTFVMKYDEWVEEFVEKYKKRVGLPFYFLIHPNLVTKKLIGAMREAGAHSVMMGVESGVERLRRKVLDRYVSDDTMVEAFNILRDNKIKVFSNTILGLPASTLKDDLTSLEFTLKCNPTYSGFTVFTPFPGTGLYKYSIENGYLDDVDSFEDSIPNSMQQGSCLKHITDKQKDIHKNILVLAPVANFMPFLKNLIVKHLIYWKPNKLFDTIGFFVRNYCNTLIFPFGKSLSTFILLFYKVLRIDKKNYTTQTSKKPSVETSSSTASSQENRL